MAVIFVIHCQFAFIIWGKFFAGGALKPTDVELLWVHVTCAWFQPEVSFEDEKAMEPASGILKIPPNSFLKVNHRAKVFFKVVVR